MRHFIRRHRRSLLIIGLCCLFSLGLSLYTRLSYSEQPEHPIHPDHPDHPIHPDHPDHPVHPDNIHGAPELDLFGLLALAAALSLLRKR